MFTEGARDSADDLIGALVDNRYKILGAMASGSMGVVFKAERIPVGKLVAIKFLHASFAQDAEFLARFERETRVMSKLAHPNCVSVVDFGVWQGSPYLVMEYVAGQTLRSVLDLGPLQPTRALGIARQIAAGLAHAHAQEIVHRDVKPANIMISEEIGTGEHVRILDFGLARLRGAVGRDATQTNVVVGTPNYMAPEQTVGGGTIDARTDVYAVGVVLFEMIAGERPFQADDTLALLGMHRAAPIPKLADRIERTVVLPPGIQDVIETAMAKDPDDRYQSAIELAAAIDAMAGARVAPDGVTVSPSARRSDVHRVESTIVDVNARNTSDNKSNNKSTAARRSGSRVGIVLALMVLAGGAGAAWYIQQQGDRGATHGDEPDPAAGLSTASGSELAAGPVPASDAGPTDPLPTGIWNGSAVAMASVDAAVDAAEVGSGSAEPAAVDSGTDLGSAEPLPIGVPDGSDSGSAAGPATGPSDGEIEMTPDPVAATNPAPEDPTKPEIDDEAEDAPKSTADVDKRTPVAPAKATTIREAVKLIQEGKRDLALASLRAIWKKTPNSAYVPFLLGNLYFDQRWWSVAMDHYRDAITKNAGYKRNATLNRNIIRMLGSVRTNKRAQVFLRRTIGRASVPYLRHAAANEKNPHVKKWAAYMAKQIR